MRDWEAERRWIEGIINARAGKLIDGIGTAMSQMAREEEDLWRRVLKDTADAMRAEFEAKIAALLKSFASPRSTD